MAFFQTVKRGQRYLERWPLHPKLAAIFPENRVIIATRFAQKAMPFLAVFAVVWQQLFAKGNNVAFSGAVLVGKTGEYEITASKCGQISGDFFPFAGKASDINADRAARLRRFGGSFTKSGETPGRKLLGRSVIFLLFGLRKRLLFL